MKILLVDDDAEIVQSLLALLEKLPGHEIRGATTGGQALQGALALGGIDLLITDVVMEPMDGFTLRDQVAARFPGARTIFISGYDLSDYTAQTAGHQVLMKPIERAELIAAIARETLPAAPEPEAAPAIPEPTPAEAEAILVAPLESAPEPVAAPVVSALPIPVAVAVPVVSPIPPPVVPVAIPVRAVAVAASGSAVRAVAAVPRVAAVPSAVPKPAATVAVPRAQSAAVPVAPSIPTPTVKAAATVKAKAVPAPKAVGAPKVVAAPKAVAKPALPVATPAPAAPASLPDDEMVGQTVGAYQIQRVLGDGRWGRVYAALQTSINRPVALKLLDPKQASDETVRTRFLGDARAKAHVQHPAIVAVYEAGEANGHVFYTHEFVEGRHLAQVQASGEKLDEFTALKVLKAAAEGLNYLNANRIPHSAPQPSSIYLGADGTPRLANLATNAGEEQAPVEQEIQALGRAMLSVLPAVQTLTPGFRTLASRMVQAGPQAVNSWGALVQGIKAIEPKVIPVEAAKISAQDRAAIAAVESARKAQKRSVYYNVIGMISIVVLAAVAVWWYFHNSNERVLDEQVVIPAGPFTFGSGQTVDLPEFSIDKYEVTIGQYAKFVQALENHPTSEFDHEKQPRIKTAEMHKPRDWAIYYGRASQGNAIHGVPSDLNMPALMVDWWDAYAYAKWKGRELPTEQEWEKAARGTSGFFYPWGNDFDPKKVNSASDFVATNPEAPGKIDGFNYWGPVDKQRDKSPFGVIGMAGNVAEWTGTWTKDQKFPIIKGGSYMSVDVRLDKRIDNVPPQTAQENLGFRTVSHSPPAK
jgi:formylglycine-generating enzyme required for sulfatase activity/CheY-like chemotaxis protein